VDLLVPSVYFTREEVEAAAGVAPWKRQRDFQNEIKPADMADTAAAYARASGEARNTRDFAVRATEISRQGGGLDGASLVNAQGRIDETDQALQRGGADIDAVAGHLVQAMNSALDTNDGVRALIYAGGTGLETKYANHLKAASDEWSGWHQALGAAVEEWNGSVAPGRHLTSPVVSYGGETVTAVQAGSSGTTITWALPDGKAEQIRAKHLKNAATDATTTHTEMNELIEVYRRQMAERAGELTRLGYDPAAGPLGLFTSNREQHIQELLRQLGIDPALWDTSKGLSFNDDRIRRVYEYYADLFLRHPELQWAGMAKLAGGLVYAGMQDLHVLRGLTADERLRWLAESMPGMPPGAANALANAGEAELDWYEDRFVDMQKQIFMDMGWQHAAYDRGGIEEMRRLASTGELPPEQLTAWEDIASGDPARISQGNEALLRREQEVILQDDYDAMQRRPLGEAVTYMLGAVSESPVRDGEPFREVVDDARIDLPDQVGIPGVVEIDTPDEITFDAPLVPTGNIANFDSRWQWIQRDMLPQYQDLLQNDMQGLRNDISRPLNERAQDYRLVPLPYDPDDGLN
jgi:hypothetical protein